MLTRLMFVMLLVGGSSATSAALSECQADCEKSYKHCTTDGKLSPNACKIEYEKCRKQCAKKDGKPSPT